MILLYVLIALWLVITGGGLMYSIRLMHRARSALVWLVAQRMNGYRRIVANGAVYRGQIRVAIFAGMVMMGLLTLAAQWYPPGGDVRTAISGAFRLLFILMALAFTYKAYLEDHELDMLINEDQRRTARTRATDQEHGP